MATTQPTDTIEVIEEHEEIFRTIAEGADDPTVAKRFGEQPLELLELDRERRD